MYKAEHIIRDRAEERAKALRTLKVLGAITITGLASLAFNVAAISTVANKNAELAELKAIVKACMQEKPGSYVLKHTTDEGYEVEEGFMCSSTSTGTTMKRSTAKEN